MFSRSFLEVYRQFSAPSSIEQDDVATRRFVTVVTAHLNRTSAADVRIKAVNRLISNHFQMFMVWRRKLLELV